MTQPLGWGVRLAPLIFTQAFLWLTFGLFAFGPWDWPLRSTDTLYTFVILAHVAILVGYLSVAHRAPAEPNQTANPRKLLTISLWATVFVMPLTCYARTGTWAPDFIGAFRNPGEAYQSAQAFAMEGANFASYVRMLTAPALAILFPVGVFYWSKWSWPVRIATLATMGLVILLSVATGQRRDMADLLVTVPFLVAGSHIAGVTKLSRRTVFAGIGATCLAVAAFSTYFVYSHVSRVGRDSAIFGVNPVTLQSPNLDNPILTFLPDGARPGVVGLINYLSTGYYGLGLAMERPVKPMYGVGHSMFLTRNVQRLTNDDSFEHRSLAVQISDKDGYTYPVFWCTAYPYFANDLGFIGVVVMLFFVGRGLALTWLEMLGRKSPYAVVFFSFLIALIFYLPATNRMLQDGEGITAFYAWLLLWSASRWVRGRSPALVRS